jgi:hypothetical protein
MPGWWCWAAFPAPPRWRRSSTTATRATACGPCCRRCGARTWWRWTILAALRRHGVGLWDVYRSCERKGSLDSAIRTPIPNDLALLTRLAPGLRAVAHNGAESARSRRLTEALGVDVHTLPSTSPANAAWSFERKLAAWHAVFSRYDLAR